MISQNLHLEAALTWLEQGFCPYPTEGDGSKKPQGKWGEFQDRLPTRAEVERWWGRNPERGIVLICGNVSGNLEMTEIEGNRADGASLDKLVAECDARDITWLWDKLNHEGYAEFSANGGIHTMYRISDHPVPGNTKIATSQKAEDGSQITYAETRGEHGYVVVAPTTYVGCSHKEEDFHAEGDSWAVFAGKIGEVPTITWEQRQAFHAAIKAAFDERVERVYEAPAPRPIRDRAPGEISPQDDFNDRGDWGLILSGRGWSYAGRMAGQELWTRPGKDPKDGHSAALGYQGSPNLYVWSGMDEERHYTKAQFVAFSDFNGDFAATTKHLASLGFGTPLEPRTSKPSRADYDYSDLLPEKVTVTDEMSENEAVQEPEPAQRPRIEKWTGVGAGRFAGKIFGKDFCEVTEEFSERGSRGWRVYEDGRWREDTTRQVRQSMIKVSDLIEAQAEAIRDRAAEAFATNESKENKQALTQAGTLVTFAKGVASDSGIKALTNMFAASGEVTRSIKEFDTNPALLCLRNGTFDLDTMTLREHDRKDLLTRRMDVEFDPAAKAPMWEQSLIDWLPDPEIRAYVQRALGYTLLGNVEEGVFFVPWGDTGCGKSQFIETIKDVFGDFGTTAEASTFRDKVYGSSDSTNNLHDLRGRRFVASSETTKGAGLNEELVKRATGEEALKTRALYQSNIEWTPEFVLWIATNFKPNLSADDGAIWRRVKPIHFPNNFSESADRIRGLGKKMRATEMAGIFNWLLEGVRAYREMGLAEPASLTQAVKDYRDENDPVAQFVTEGQADGFVTIADGAEIESSKLYNVFAEFCATNNMRLIDPRRFGRLMSARGFDTRKGTGGVRIRVGITATWIAAQNRPAGMMHGWNQGRS